MREEDLILHCPLATNVSSKKPFLIQFSDTVRIQMLYHDLEKNNTKPIEQVFYL